MAFSRFLALALLAAAAPALAQPAAPPAPVVPVPPPAAPGPTPPEFPELTTTPLNRVVPVNEARTIAFFTALYPDCSSQGPLVARLVSKPEHGTVTFSQDQSFPRYSASSPLGPCNAKKAPGLKVTFEAAEGYEGLDRFRMLLIYPDGTAGQYDVRVSIR
ncbi:hypothetical protein [Methylobacterium oryzisoli]|uniref:hypothetical protein n=1 Tax=Methylobacterium oryzisoli TaxID=3385502 RepID=UPI0038922FAF